MPSAGFCSAVRRPLDRLSRLLGDTEQISRGKLNRLRCTTAGSTLRALDGYGLRDTLPARPALAPRIRFLFIGSHLCSTLPSDPASRRQPLRFANPSPPSGWVEDFHLRAIEHARHTTIRLFAGAVRQGQVAVSVLIAAVRASATFCGSARWCTACRCCKSSPGGLRQPAQHDLLDRPYWPERQHSPVANAPLKSPSPAGRPHPRRRQRSPAERAELRRARPR
jgi:hypothetical protein